MTALRVLALDLSLRATGIAVTHASDGSARLSCRTIETTRSANSPTLTDHRRLHQIFYEVCRAVRCDPDLAVIEWLPQIEGHGDASLRIAELHGLVKHWLFSQKITYVDVRPQELKTYATGNANAPKERVREEITGRYGKRANVHIGTQDEADAFALLALALDAYGQPITDQDGHPIEVPSSHRVAVGKLHWPELTPRAVA